MAGFHPDAPLIAAAVAPPFMSATAETGERGTSRRGS